VYITSLESSFSSNPPKFNAIFKTISFSVKPNSVGFPGSLPPWPASITILNFS
tara:strand:+ start:908 stop:1066 length:159 start_codon:yes stop_codon:yes gene_type:complete